jgi:5-methylcytosine-specific restriction endonuclease McrA
MSNVRSKSGRIKLLPDRYRELRRQILERDNWQCQLCGARMSLEVHHRQFRSQLGDDSEYNLITLCHTCHARAHLEL